MKICFVCNDLNSGAGWGRLVSELAKSIRTAGHKVGFVLGKGEPDSNTLILPMRFDAGNIFRIPSTIFKIRKFISKYDLVISIDVNPYGVFTYLASAGLPVKTVVYAIGTYSLFGQSKIKNMLMRRTYNEADEVFVLSDFVRRQIEKNSFRFKKYQIVPAGVNTELFKPIGASSVKLETPFILSVGALKQRKGYHLSIPAFKIISEKYPDLKYVIIGDSDLSAYSNLLNNLVKELGLSEKVIFLEKVSDQELLQYYSQARLFFLTPVTTNEALEGFGMVYLEAGACGKPVVGTLNTGAEATIVDRVTGFLVEGEPAQIAKGVDRILGDEKLAVDMGQNGIRHAQEFSWSRVAQIHVNSYKKLLNRGVAI